MRCSCSWSHTYRPRGPEAATAARSHAETARIFIWCRDQDWLRLFALKSHKTCVKMILGESEGGNLGRANEICWNLLYGKTEAWGGGAMNFFSKKDFHLKLSEFFLIKLPSEISRSPDIFFQIGQKCRKGIAMNFQTRCRSSPKSICVKLWTLFISLTPPSGLS